MDPQQLARDETGGKPLARATGDETDDVTGHRHAMLDGGDDGAPAVTGRRHEHVDGDDDTDDVSGHLSGALGSKKHGDR
jgi:hypothetical protein